MVLVMDWDSDVSDYRELVAFIMTVGRMNIGRTMVDVG